MRRATLRSARDLMSSMKNSEPPDCNGKDDSDNKKATP